MRIRKNAKLSASIIVGSSSIPPENLQAHVCQLNRSPWDVLFSSPPPPHSSSYYRFEGDDSFAVNGSLDDSIAAVEISFVSTNGGMTKVEQMELEGSDGSVQIEARNAKTTFCNKTDGKGWQYQRAAKEGHSLCNHHLSQLRSCHQDKPPTPSPLSAAATTSAKKLEKAAGAPPKRRGRPRKTPVVATNPNEFYYYSGFGPRWGKKRGGSNSSKAELEKIVETEGNDNTSGVVAGASTSSSSQDRFDNIVMESVEELDYIDDEDDEEEIGGGAGGGDGGELCRKRGRKPIKARSLKSLM
ncbi:hypothetical protein Ancab_037887 [Ancistrocladus abbreviatus]